MDYLWRLGNWAEGEKHWFQISSWCEDKTEMMINIKTRDTEHISVK